MTRESAASIATRLAAEVGVKTIIAAAKFFDLVLGGSPRLRPPAFDEAEAQRFLSDGAEELAVAEEREEVSEPRTFICPWHAAEGIQVVGTIDESGIANCPRCIAECEQRIADSAPGSRSEAPVAADAPGPSSSVRAVDPGQPTIVGAFSANIAPPGGIANFPVRTVPPATSADQTTSALMAALINQVRISRAVIVGDESRRRYIAELIADSEARAAQHEQVGD